MSKKSVKQNLDIKRDAPNQWEKAIEDAEEMIGRARTRIKKLRGSILVFKDRRDSGEPFPCRRSARDAAPAPIHTKRIHGAG